MPGTNETIKMCRRNPYFSRIERQRPMRAEMLVDQVHQGIHSGVSGRALPASLIGADAEQQMQQHGDIGSQDFIAAAISTFKLGRYPPQDTNGLFRIRHVRFRSNPLGMSEPLAKQASLSGSMVEMRRQDRDNRADNGF